MKISIDIDGVLADFYSSYFKLFSENSNISKNVRKLAKNKEFWLNLKALNTLEFMPKQYTTARIIPKSWIKKYLRLNNFPDAPVYQVLGYNLSKSHHIKAGGCDVHIDDSLSVFFDLNLKGIPCLLYNTPSNQEWKGVGRIYDLTIEEINRVYKELTNHNNFKELYYEYFGD